MTERRWILMALCACCLFAIGGGNVARAQQSGARRPDPATEIYQINEAQRQARVARQRDLNLLMIYRTGWGPRLPGVFEPWPIVPGDIWGFPPTAPVEHPVGQETIQLSPTRWISRPVYAWQTQTVPPQQQVTPSPKPRVLKPSRAPIVPPAAPNRQSPAIELPGPSIPEPDDVPIQRQARSSPAAKSNPATGPREF